MNDPTTPAGQWRTGVSSSAGFRQFYREWRPRVEPHLPVLALHGSLTQSGMWIELANTAAARVAGVVLVDPVVRVPGVSAPRGPAAPHPDSCATIEEAQRHYLATEEGAWTLAALARFTRDVMIEADGARRFPYTGESKRFPAAAQEPFVAAFRARPKTVLCPASGHFPAATEPDIVAGALVQFLAALR